MIRRLATALAVTLVWAVLPMAAQAASPELDEQAVLDALEERDPAAYEAILQLKETSPASYRSRLEAAHGKMLLKEEHPDWFEAEDRIGELESKIDRRIGVYRASPEGEQGAIYEDLLELTEEMQELRLDSYRLRIELMRLRLADLERQVRTREDEREEFNRRWLERRLERER